MSNITLPSQIYSSDAVAQARLKRSKNNESAAFDRKIATTTNPLDAPTIPSQQSNRQLNVATALSNPALAKEIATAPTKSQQMMESDAQSQLSYGGSSVLSESSMSIDIEPRPLPIRPPVAASESPSSTTSSSHHPRSSSKNGPAPPKQRRTSVLHKLKKGRRPSISTGSKSQKRVSIAPTMLVQLDKDNVVSVTLDSVENGKSVKIKDIKQVPKLSIETPKPVYGARNEVILVDQLNLESLSPAANPAQKIGFFNKSDEKIKREADSIFEEVVHVSDEETEEVKNNTRYNAVMEPHENDGPRPSTNKYGRSVKFNKIQRMSNGTLRTEGDLRSLKDEFFDEDSELEQSPTENPKESESIANAEPETPETPHFFDFKRNILQVDTDTSSIDLGSLVQSMYSFSPNSGRDSYTSTKISSVIKNYESADLWKPSTESLFGGLLNLPSVPESPKVPEVVFDTYTESVKADSVRSVTPEPVGIRKRKKIRHVQTMVCIATTVKYSHV